ncbi:FAD-linked oxidase C-terminal domain-containing protein, partial [uncultured Methylobacterium sp.]|uniref:FAD-linked oxidase C-terminal domain-containing protein n=1 Tax=uncultured Methylobacterium sp. TaxID=157278 RepID=UPI0035CAAA0D
HGIGQIKRDELARYADPVGLDLMHSLKAALDPHHLLNPGKVLPGKALPGQVVSSEVAPGTT